MRARRILLILAVAVAVLLLWRPMRDTEEEARSLDEKAEVAAADGLTASAEQGKGPVLRTRNAAAEASDPTQSSDEGANRVHVHVTSGGKPVPRRGVRVCGTAYRPARTLLLDFETGADGRCTLRLPPGLFQIGLIPSPSSQPSRGLLTGTAALDAKWNIDDPQSIELKTDAGKAQLSFEVPAGSLRVLVRDGATDRPIEGAAVSMRSSGRQRPLSRLGARTDEDGVAVLTEFEPGQWDVTAWKRGWIPDPELPTGVPVLVEDEHATVSIPLLACGTLVVRFLDEAGQLIDPTPPYIPTLCPIERGRAGQPITPYSRLLSVPELRNLASTPARVAMRPTELLPGTYTISIEDKQAVVKGVRLVRLQPFEPLPEREFAIRRRETTTLELTIRPRCRVILNLRPSNGRASMPHVRIKVYRVDETTGQRLRYLSIWESVQPRRPMPMNMFNGYLQPGTYEVEIASIGTGTVVRREPLIVEGPLVKRSYIVEPAGR